MPETNASSPQAEPQAEAAADVSEGRTARSVVLLGFGGPRMIKVTGRPEMEPTDGDVLINVKACGVGFSDLMARQGVIDNHPKPPMVMGFECSGEIVAVGENVEGLAVGNRVMALSHYRAWSEQLIVPAKYVYKMPDSMSYQDGAALPMSFVSAYIMLFHMGNLRKGNWVLVHSAGGAVGQAVAQLARTVDGVTLVGTASKHKHDALRNTYNHVYEHTQDYVQEVKKSSPGGVDLVLDCLCGDDCNKGMNLLKPMGKYILFGSANVITGDTKSLFSFAKSWWQVDKISPLKLYDENKAVAGFMLRRLLFDQDCHEYVRGVMEEVLALYTSGKIRPCIDSTYAFEDADEALQRLQDRKNLGKVLLDPSQEPVPREEPAQRSPLIKQATALFERVIPKSSGETEEAEGEKENGVESSGVSENAADADASTS